MAVKNFFWDSCVLVSFLNQEGDNKDIPSLNRFILDAKNGDCRLYASTITIAEILPSYLKDKKFSTYQKFLEDMEDALIQISPSPNILALSARLRDIEYSKAVTRNQRVKRKMDVPDAIILATAVVLSEGHNVSLDAFHTSDNGRKRSVEGGRCVPILSFETWCEKLNQRQGALARKVTTLNRTTPVHPTPDLPGV